MRRERRRSPALDGVDALSQRPDVVVGESQRLDLGQLCLVWKCGQHVPQLLQCHVEHVHAVALAVVGLCAADALQTGDLGGSTAGQAGRASVYVIKEQKDYQKPSFLIDILYWK